MQLPELQKQLVEKVVQPFYLFVGEEVGIMDIYMQKIAEVAGADLKRVDSLKDIFAGLRANSFLSRPTCYVIRDDRDLLKQDESVWQGLQTGVTQGKNIIILVYTSLDKRTKFYKMHENIITEFVKLSGEILAKYAQKEIGLNEKYGYDLAHRANLDYTQLMLECDKLRILSQVRGVSIDEAYRQAIAEKLIYTAPQDVAFDFVDAFCKRQVKKAFELWAELQESDSNPLGMLALLYNNFRAMLLVSGGGNNLAQRTGLTSWQVKNAQEKGNNYSVRELVEALRILQGIEQEVKTGQIEAGMAVDYALISIL
ncbi:MAG TPA: hypothetical protein PKI14_12675 [Fervidobacterium sp.]|nr:hypothetical protein [Fervidobacterium sp.]